MLKFDHATGSAALRSVYPEDGWNAWLVSHPANGAHWAASGQVEDWIDVPIPEEAP